MQGETDVSYSLSALVTEVEGVALATAQSQEVSDNELSEVLSFLAKVSHVVEQAFRGVILIEIKFLRPNDLQPDRMQRLRHKTDLVLARSHFRDAEEICSRLRTLTESYQTDLDGRTIGPRIRISRPDGGNARCNVLRAAALRKNSSQPTPPRTTLSTSNAISRQLNHTACYAPRR